MFWLWNVGDRAAFAIYFELTNLAESGSEYEQGRRAWFIQHHDWNELKYETIKLEVLAK